MPNEIAVQNTQFKKLVMRDGTVIKLAHDPMRIENIYAYLATGRKELMEIDGRMINPVDIVGIFNDEDKPTGALHVVSQVFLERLLEDGARDFEWVVVTRSGLEQVISSREYHDLLGILKSTKSGKMLVGMKTIDILEITTISMKSEYDRAKNLKAGYWECELGNLHEKGEKHCDKPSCYLKNSKRYNELSQSLHDHHTRENCTLKQHDLGKWHLCETVQKEYNELIALENYAKGLARYED